MIKARAEEDEILILRSRYLQMSGMILGSMIEADYRMRQYEHQIRIQRRVAHDRAMWEMFEREYKEEGAPPPPPRPKHIN